MVDAEVEYIIEGLRRKIEALDSQVQDLVQKVRVLESKVSRLG